MALTPSTMLPLGTGLPMFRLPDVDGVYVGTDDWTSARALLVVFMCNHCPFVVHLKSALSGFAREFAAQGLVMVGVNSNDAVQYPADGPDVMRQDMAAFEYPFPYLVDADQSVAKMFRAACTPDFFLFDAARRLVYRGQFDDSRPQNGVPVTGRDLREAVMATLDGRPVTVEQKPAMGCNIKWKPGNEPDYFAR